MRKMLEELFYGNINPNEKQFIRNTDFDRAMCALSENEDKLTELLDGKEKKLFLDLVNAQGMVNGTTTVENFINGFRLGAKIALEIISDEDGCLHSVEREGYVGAHSTSTMDGREMGGVGDLLERILNREDLNKAYKQVKAFFGYSVYHN